MKRYLIPLIIRKMQIKTTLKYHFPPVKMAIILEPETSAGPGVERWNLCAVGEV